MMDWGCTMGVIVLAGALLEQCKALLDWGINPIQIAVKQLEGKH